MYIMIICHWAILHYNMSFTTIGGRSDGGFWWFSCTFWRSRKKLSNSPKLSCGFKLVITRLQLRSTCVPGPFSPSSWDTLLARLVAEILRGWVQMMNPWPPLPEAIRSCDHKYKVNINQLSCISLELWFNTSHEFCVIHKGRLGDLSSCSVTRSSTVNTSADYLS